MTQIVMTTSLGKISLRLDAARAPATVENFVAYARGNFYDGTIFHRVIPGFMVQGGGFERGLKERKARSPIKNEAQNGLKNRRGSIAMARRPDPHSASAQFFINLKDNDFLDFKAANAKEWGYCVFGEVTEGMDVVDQIARVQTGSRGMHQDVPQTDVLIEKVEVIEAA